MHSHEKQKSLRKAQTPLEIIGISVVLVGLLLVVLLTTYDRNIQTQDMLTIGESNILCQKTSSSIARIYSNRATIKETITLTRTVLFERAEGRAGIISIESISCPYIAPAQKNTGEKDTDPGGLYLTVGKWCFEKLGSNVLITPGDCT